MSGLDEVRRKFNRSLNQKNVCSFLVERPLTLRSSPNSSLTAARSAAPPLVEMGDDASEIGCREAVRYLTMGDKYQVKSILKGEIGRDPTVTATLTRSEEDIGKKTKIRGKQKKKKSVSYEGKLNKISKVPSDVKDEDRLQKVTPKSGIIGFVRNYLSR